MAKKASKKPKPDDTPPVATPEELTAAAPHPASNLMLADIVMRMGTSVLRKGVETTFLRGKYGKDAAKALVQDRSLSRTLTSLAIAKVGSKSIPGAALVGGGLVIKALFDRSKARQRDRQAARKSERAASLPTDQNAD